MGASASKGGVVAEPKPVDVTVTRPAMSDRGERLVDADRRHQIARESLLEKRSTPGSTRPKTLKGDGGGGLGGGDGCDGDGGGALSRSPREAPELAMGSCEMSGIELPADALAVVVEHLLRVSVSSAARSARVSRLWKAVVNERRAACGMLYIPELQPPGSPWGAWGGGFGQLRDPHDCVVLPCGDVVVTDFSNNRLQRFCVRDASWRAVDAHGSAGLLAPRSQHRVLYDPASYYFPTGLAFVDERCGSGGESGALFVADMSNALQKVRLSDGAVLKRSRTFLCCPYGLAVLPQPPRSGRGGARASDYAVLVADSGGNQVVMFSSNLDHICTIGWGALRNPTSVACCDGEVYVVDSGHRRIAVFAPGRAERADDPTGHPAGETYVLVRSLGGPSGGEPNGFAFIQPPSSAQLVGDWLAVAEDGGRISLLSRADGAAVCVLDLPEAGLCELVGGMAVHPSCRLLLCAAKSTHTLIALDIAGAAPAGAAPLASRPDAARRRGRSLRSPSWFRPGVSRANSS